MEGQGREKSSTSATGTHGFFSPASTEQPIFHAVSLALQLVNEPSEGLALILGIGAAVDVQPSPIHEFLHILQHDHTGMHLLRPAHRDPRQSPDVPRHRLAAFGLGVVFAVRREPGQRHRTPRTGFHRIHLPYVLRVMLGGRVVRPVHGDCRRIVIDGDVYTPSDGNLYPRRGTAAPGKIVNNDFSHVLTSTEIPAGSHRPSVHVGSLS